jgi:hypothetical protein
MFEFFEDCEELLTSLVPGFWTETYQSLGFEPRFKQSGAYYEWFDRSEKKRIH